MTTLISFLRQAANSAVSSFCNDNIYYSEYMEDDIHLTSVLILTSALALSSISITSDDPLKYTAIINDVVPSYIQVKSLIECII